MTESITIISKKTLVKIQRLFKFSEHTGRENESTTMQHHEATCLVLTTEPIFQELLIPNEAQTEIMSSTSNFTMERRDQPSPTYHSTQWQSEKDLPLRRNMIVSM